MEHIKNTSINNTTKLIGIQDLNIKIARRTHENFLFILLSP